MSVSTLPATSTAEQISQRINDYRPSYTNAGVFMLFAVPTALCRLVSLTSGPVALLTLSGALDVRVIVVALARQCPMRRWAVPKSTSQTIERERL